MIRISDILAQRMERIRKGEKASAGFTLIELLVVIIIIGILAAIAIPVFLNQRQSAWRSSVQSDVHAATLAMETYGTANNGSYSSLAAGATTVSDTTAVTSKVSDGNTIKYLKVDGNSYKVWGTNSNDTTADPGKYYVYSSSTGKSVWNKTEPTATSTP